jgi:hypothetical protein
MRLPSSHPDYARAKRLADLFNITIAEYDKILRHQGGVCAICGLPPKPKALGGNRLSVDHNHQTGLVRGLVHWKCNEAIGLLELLVRKGVNPQRLLDYLQRPPATSALGGERYGRTGRVTAKRKRSTKKTTTTRKKRK